MNTLLSRRSIRAYTDRLVEEEILNQIIQAVQAVPSGSPASSTGSCLSPQKSIRPTPATQRQKPPLKLPCGRWDYVGLLLIHEPYRISGEMYRAMRETYQEGKAKAIDVPIKRRRIPR